MDYTVPIKMPRNAHYGSNYYEFFSRKNHRIATAFSSLEYWNLICLEMDYFVKQYCEQPLEVEVFFDGKKYRTVFDVWVKYENDCVEFQEIKYSKDISSENSLTGRSFKQIAIQKAWCEQNSKNYVVKTEEDFLKSTYFMRNLLYLYPKVLRVDNVDIVAEKYILRFIKDRGMATIGQLINNGIISLQNGIDTLALLYYEGDIDFCNIKEEPFGFTTEVCVRYDKKEI